MKLIVVGATGLIGTEVIRQALSHKSVTSVVALGRRPTPPPESVPAGPELEKACQEPALRRRRLHLAFNSLHLEPPSPDTNVLPPPLRLLAITPTASKRLDFEAVKTVCVDYVMKGFDTLKQLPRPKSGKPLRFVYASGAKAERDQTKKPWILGDYTLMRGRVETQLLDATAESGGVMEMCLLRIGLVKSPERMGYITGMLAHAAAGIIGLPLIDIREIGGAAVSAAVHGFDKDTLDNDELIAMGRKELREIGEEPST
ncbi:nucleoside-diphosphate-sugar epimerase, putative [Beauveria bassiana ARSEF 2860]|uniref:Nucleoside-diphosphate-sugar epimerase, putative n=1 Tax=Beauveria bassiana (strain ARSEF 2860) TaxID=655819 RepID=J4W6A9_BEAB2|nr:nucleoside-diphosphate-sugar epimerase, putative [Beauveria bassiana ARSEF 2860]EJP65845.1 nucleoside-diphosphate-sugar epimerase, putative [Beauveria bassiana ARSEF 2860]